jgi:hypothetical protein
MPLERLPLPRTLADQIEKLKRRIAGSGSREGRPTRKDRLLARRLYRAFERDVDLIDVEGIRFYVQHGTVTLYGTIRHEVDRDLIVSLVRQVPGVLGVVPHLQVVEARHQGTPPVSFFDRPPGEDPRPDR